MLAHTTVGITRYFDTRYFDDEEKKTAPPGVLGIRGTGGFQYWQPVLLQERTVAAHTNTGRLAQCSCDNARNIRTTAWSDNPPAVTVVGSQRLLLRRGGTDLELLQSGYLAACLEKHQGIGTVADHAYAFLQKSARVASIDHVPY